ncbi:hypothetical protein EVAR_79149_1 [Eumeta japonica]|uniref:Uncharacterized protein n=1 Tax=Eumeta variegata TaxID=151549 RepID=A0A4C1UTQ2_EUMVA|nr:hypothetical protein EVAR_79149_1 [Eumeta japonica]
MAVVLDGGVPNAHPPSPPPAATAQTHSKAWPAVTARVKGISRPAQTRLHITRRRRLYDDSPGIEPVGWHENRRPCRSDAMSRLARPRGERLCGYDYTKRLRPYDDRRPEALVFDLFVRARRLSRWLPRTLSAEDVHYLVQKSTQNVYELRIQLEKGNCGQRTGVRCPQPSETARECRRAGARALGQRKLLA